MAIKFAVKAKQQAAEKTKPVEKAATAGTIVDGKVNEKAVATSAKTTAKKVAKKPVKVAPKTESKVVSPTAIKAKLKPLAKPLLEIKDKIAAAKKQMAPLEAEYKKMSAEALSIVVDSGLDRDSNIEVIDGEAYLSVGVAQTTRSIESQRAIFDALAAVDKDLPWKLLSFKLTDVDKYLPKTVADKLVASKHTDKRTVTVKTNE
ncbi:hypothetical protein [Vibrio phage V-YDF132]|nr:hypothetical protein [Vibrio phage V-YDF132]